MLYQDICTSSFSTLTETLLIQFFKIQFNPKIFLLGNSTVCRIKWTEQRTNRPINRWLKYTVRVITPKGPTGPTTFQTTVNWLNQWWILCVRILHRLWLVIFSGNSSVSVAISRRCGYRSEFDIIASLVFIAEILKISVVCQLKGWKILFNAASQRNEDSL